MGAELQRLSEPLQHFLVRADTLKLVEYRTGEERFLAAAEELNRLIYDMRPHRV